jgi:transglutaminase-like putative cysteine protease
VCRTCQNEGPRSPLTLICTRAWRSSVSRFAPKDSPLAALLISVVTLFLCSLPLRATSERSRPSGKGAVTAREPRASRSFDFRYVVDVATPPAGSRQLKIWLPLPYESSPYQAISALRIKSPVRYQIRQEREFDNRYAYFDLDAPKIKEPFQIELMFHVKRFEHRVPLHTVAGAPARTEAVNRFLRPDRLVPIDGEIKQFSRQQTVGANEPLEKARKIYDYVIATMHYDHAGTGWGRGDAVWACNAKHGNCTDFHSLFIGMARAAGIPARFEIGFPLPLNAHDGTIPGYHCWAEFFVSGSGWIPIDASEAWQDPSKKNYFFGATDENRVMFSLGRDIRLNPPPAATPLNFFVYPYAEVDGKPFTALKHEFSFRDDAAAPTTTAQNR